MSLPFVVYYKYVLYYNDNSTDVFKEYSELFGQYSEARHRYDALPKNCVNRRIVERRVEEHTLHY